jgi:GTP-binding protein HflX
VRLTGLGASLSRLGGGIGTRGPGEKRLEMDRRLIRERISILKRELEEVKRHRDVTRQKRSANPIPVISIVGYTNAGKSTLLSTVSAARPKIADYPFTTLEPNLGIVSYYDDKSFVMADIPGIIEGAHEGKGIGMRFLRHIERNSILLFMVAADQDDIREGYEVLLNELREYNPELLVKDRVLAITKSDMLDDQLKSEIEEQLPTDIPHVFISSFTQEGIKELKNMLWDALQKEIPVEDEPVVLFPGDDNEKQL